MTSVRLNVAGATHNETLRLGWVGLSEAGDIIGTEPGTLSGAMVVILSRVILTPAATVRSLCLDVPGSQ
jgi:hypothetical protein